MYARLKEFVEQSDSEEESNNAGVEIKKIKTSKLKEEDLNDEDAIQYDYDKEAFKKFTKVKKEDRLKANNNLNLREDEVDQENSNIAKVNVDYCELCNRRVNNEKEVNEHLISKLHRRKLKNMTVQEISEFRHISDYLISKGFISKKRNLSNKLKALLYKISLKNLISEKF